MIGQITHGRHLDEARAAFGPRFGDHHDEQRTKVRLDRHAMRDHGFRGLRRLVDPCSAAPDATCGAMDEHDAADEIDIIHPERGDLARAQIEIRRQGEKTPPAHGNALARHELRELARVEPRLRTLHAAIGAGHARGWVVGPNAQRSILCAASITARCLKDRPRIDRGLRADLLGAYRFVEPFHDALAMLAAEAAHGQMAKDGRDPFLPPSGRVLGGDDVARDPIRRPAHEPFIGGLVGRRCGIARRVLSARQLGGLFGERARLRFGDARIEVLRLTALAIGEPDPDVPMIAVPVDVTLARAACAALRRRGVRNQFHRSLPSLRSAHERADIVGGSRMLIDANAHGRRARDEREKVSARYEPDLSDGARWEVSPPDRIEERAAGHARRQAGLRIELGRRGRAQHFDEHFAKRSLEGVDVDHHDAHGRG